MYRLEPGAWSLNQLSVSQAVYMKGNIQVDILQYVSPEASDNPACHSVRVQAPVIKIRVLVAN
jgi:hypothetical protein